MPGSKMGFCFGITEAECRDLGSPGVESQIRVLDDWGANEERLGDTSPTTGNPRDKVLLQH